MAMYQPDHEYINSLKVIKGLDDSPKDKAIKYYIEYNKRWHDKDKKKLERYYKFFQTLSSLLHKSGGILN